MAPAKKSRSVNRQFSPTTDICPSKEDSARKSLQRKRKLSDMLGPEWSEEDLTRFYQAYHRYGKDWKKVAAAVKPRTAEMVEALYTMNREKPVKMKAVMKTLLETSYCCKLLLGLLLMF